MAISQNVCFTGDEIPDAEFGDPPGATVTKLLRVELLKRGWDVSDIDLWRGAGWLITCSRSGSVLELTLAKIGDADEWFLQIAPSYVPGIVGWLLSRRASANPDDIQALAQEVFIVLSENGRFRGFMWRWDGPPEPGCSTPEPMTPNIK